MSTTPPASVRRPPANPLTRAQRALIRYPRYKQLHEDIQQCRHLSLEAQEAQCMVLEGPPGAGKTTLVREYASAFPAIEGSEGRIIPVFYLETPSPVTVKGMAATMLGHLGDPAADKGTLWSMNYRLTHLLVACGVELVILDDFHHLIDAETNRILMVVSDWLKVLIKETGIPFLVVGIEGKVNQILTANPQLARLFAFRDTLHPFRWNLEDRTTIVEFRDFVDAAVAAIDMRLTTELAEIDLLYRLYQATGGIVANVMNLLRQAHLLAVQAQHRAIELADLAAAFTRRLADHRVGVANPFIPVPALPNG